jgi:Fe-S cluster assembly iron-binding protein IscA
MPLAITEAATEVLERAYEAATRFNPEARIRIYLLGETVETGFADAPEETDEVIEHNGMTLFLERGISGTLDVSAEHDRLLVR